MIARKKKTKSCSFCGLGDDVVTKLLAGPRVYICGDCVGTCNDILDADVSTPLAQLSELSAHQILSTLKPMQKTVESRAQALGERVDELRQREVSWALIGKALGVSRQAAWERFS